jgi:hypothetical protein
MYSNCAYDPLLQPSFSLQVAWIPPKFEIKSLGHYTDYTIYTDLAKSTIGLFELSMVFKSFI